MRETLFHGEFNLRIDRRRRLTIPKELRLQIAATESDALMAVVGRNGKLWLYPDRDFAALAAGAGGSEVLETPLRILTLAVATRLECDRRGRVTLPEKLLTEFRLFEHVSLIGVGDHCELWEREEWDLQRAVIIDVATR